MNDGDNPITKKEDDDFDLTSFWAYLGTPAGHEVATRIVAIFEALRHAGMDRNAALQKTETYLRYGMVLAVIVAAVYLSINDKFDSTIGVLFGTLIGFFFGRNRKG